MFKEGVVICEIQQGKTEQLLRMAVRNTKYSIDLVIEMEENKMIRKNLAVVLAAVMTLSLAACSASSGESSMGGGADTSTASMAATDGAQTSKDVDAGSEQTSQDADAGSAVDGTASGGSVSGGTYGSLLGKVSNTIAEDEDKLVSTYANGFQQLTYDDKESGLSIIYNLYLPEGYDESNSYPTVVFIADSSCVGDDATVSLKQGKGALVWATEEWQAVNPTIIAVPTYPETILDDHDGYTTTEYVELTKRFIDYISGAYAVDTSRIYGTGQSMGCMTTLILASKYPDLYAACMFVDGQWDVSALKGLENQTFVYFAAEDDTNAWAGAQEVMAMFDTDSVEYKYAQWDGTWSADELSKEAQELFSDGTDRYFISWKTGTIDASTGSMSGFAGGGNGDSAKAPRKMKNRGSSNTAPENMPNNDSTSEANGGLTLSFEMPDNAGISDVDGSSVVLVGMSNNNGTSDVDASSSATAMMSNNGRPSGTGGPNGSSGMGSVSYHMASFDYAYNCIAVMEWLFLQ